jgi:multiple sugar transport system substrate-binding protein
LAALTLVAAPVLAGCGSSSTSSESTSAAGSAAASAAASAAGSAAASAAPAGECPDNPLCGSDANNMQGKTIDFGYSRIGGWPPSAAPEAMWPAFQAYAKEKFGYTANLTFAEAPFGELFQKIAPTLASGSQEFNLMIVDSQWLGALAEPGWIVPADQIYALNPDLDKEPYSSLVSSTYQVYPDGSGQRWGFPQMPDTQGVAMRLDMLQDPANQKAFQEKYGRPLGTTFADYENITMKDFEDVIAFFNRPDQGMYGTALQYSKDYDFFSCAYYPFVYSTGGEIWDPATNNVEGILNTDGNAKAMEEFVALKKYQAPSFATQGIGELIDLFTKGKVFSAFQWNAVGAAMITPELKDKVLFIPLPKFPGADGQPTIVGAMGGQPWVVNAFNDDEHMRVSIDFLNWWYQPETQSTFINDNGGLPWDKEGVNNPEYMKTIPYMGSFKYMLEEGRSKDFWHVPEYSEMLAVQQEAFNAYATGQIKSAKAALDYVAAKQQAILFDAGRTTTAPPEGTADMTLPVG